jgi:hypothetical protein
MQEAHELGSGGGDDREFASMIKDHTGHSNPEAAFNDKSGAFNESKKWLSVSTHAKAMKDAYEAGKGCPGEAYQRTIGKTDPVRECGIELMEAYRLKNRC